MGVVGPGKVPWPALMAGPYVPLCLLRKCLWVRGVPTCIQIKDLFTSCKFWLCTLQTLLQLRNLKSRSVSKP